MIDKEIKEKLIQRWEKVLEGIDSEYTREVTAILLENQAKHILVERDRLDEEALTPGATTVGQLGTFQKFSFPLVRRVWPQLIANSVVGVQPMQGPVSQIFYLGHSRAGDIDGNGYSSQAVYSKFNLTYRGLAASSIGSLDVANSASGTGQFAGGVAAGSQSGLDGDDAVNGFDVTSVIGETAGSPSTTYGGQIAGFPDGTTTLGWSVSAGENLRISGIPDLTFHIEQQAVVARTRKMRALWTLEASQDLKAYHNLDLERELTDLLSKEVALEIDRELIEDLRMIAYNWTGVATLGGWDAASLENGNPNSFGAIGGQGTAGRPGDPMTPGSFTYDQTNLPTANSSGSNVFVVDFTQSTLSFSPRHIGDVYANLMGVINIASQDIFRTTQRGPGTFMITSPLVASFLESSSKLHGGIAPEDKPTNLKQRIEYKGKFAGKYDLYIDPLFPVDEILMGYKGENAMDAGFVYAPYIPLQQLPTITDPENFQPRKGILTRYGKAAITPQSRFYRVIRIVGPTANWLYNPYARNTTIEGAGGLAYS